jgi:hypothetical protein
MMPPPSSRLRLSLLGFLLLAALLASAPAGAAPREHDTHGTVRKLCVPAVMRHWAGGPSAGRLERGTNVRRFDLGPRLALGVTNGHRPVVRGYVARSAFCPPSARGRRALARARALAARSGRGRPATLLVRPVLRRVCADEVYLRDRPLNRAVSLMFRGDAILTDRRARNPWRGGAAYGHANRRGFVPEAALCHGIARRLPGHRATAVEGLAAVRVLAPPAVPSCARRIDGKRLLQVGARIPRGVTGDRLSVTARLERGGRPVSVTGARFAGVRGRTRYAAVGPLACGREHTLVYLVRRGGRTVGAMRWEVVPGGMPQARAASLRAVSAGRPLARPAPLGRAAGACTGTPGKAFAHGGTGPVDHRFHVRPALSADGRFVAFDSPGRLVAADRDRERDVYRRDLRTGALVLVSASSAPGKSRAPAISGDGSVVAFESDAPGMVPDDHDRVRDVFVANLVAGTVQRVSAGAARTPALSADGRRVAYERTGKAAALVVQRVADGAVLRTVAAAYRPALSGDGAFVAYETRRPVGPRDLNRSWDVARVPVAAGPLVLVSVARAGRPPRGASLSASLNADGSVVAFQSDAAGLVRGDRNRLRDVFVRNLGVGRTVRVSVDRCGGDPDGYSRYPSLSADGRRVAFDSHASDLVRADTDARGHAYVATVRADARPRLVDTRPGGAPSSRTAFSPALSADGGTVAFPTFGYDLGPHDANRRVDVYTRRMAAGARPRRAG